MLAKHQVFGQVGELYAERFLKKQKYKILAKNHKTPFGELDIIAKTKNTYVFVEVKARSSTAFGLPQEAVTRKKQLHIINSAEHYLDKNKLFDVDYRFDIIEVVGDTENFEINHIIYAFA